MEGLVKTGDMESFPTFEQGLMTIISPMMRKYE